MKVRSTGIFLALAIPAIALAAPTTRSTMLIEPAQLQSQLNDDDIRLLDVRSAEEYEQGHIPGAVRVDVDDWKSLSLADGGLRDAKGWAARLGAVGITGKSQVVVYGSRLTDSARIWWLLKYVGVERAALLNGSWETWVKSQRPVATTSSQTAATSFRPSFQADRLADAESVKKSLNSAEVQLVDTRSDAEFNRGRIPGSAHLEWSELIRADGRFKSEAELRKLFRARGILPNEAAVCY